MDNGRLNEIIYILEHIRREDKEELIALYGKKWKKKTINGLKNAKMRVVYGYNTKRQYVPVAIGGIESVNPEIPGIACAWLLTTRYIYKNKRGLIEVLKDEFQKADEKYHFIYNFIHKSNYKAKSWLKKFGFSFESVSGIEVPENFEFFYKITKGKQSMCVLSTNIALAVSAVISSVSALYAEHQSVKQQNFEIKQNVKNAIASENLAKNEKQEGIEEARRARLQAILATGDLKSRIAAGNIGLNSMTALNLEETEMLNGENNALSVLKNADNRAASYMNRAQAYYGDAQLTSLKAKGSFNSTLLNSGMKIIDSQLDKNQNNAKSKAKESETGAGAVSKLSSIFSFKKKGG